MPKLGPGKVGSGNVGSFYSNIFDLTKNLDARNLILSSRQIPSFTSSKNSLNFSDYRRDASIGLNFLNLNQFILIDGIEGYASGSYTGPGGNLGDLREKAIVVNGPNNKVIENLYGSDVTSLGIGVVKESPFRALINGPRTKFLSLTPFGSNDSVSLVYEFAFNTPNNSTNNQTPYEFNFLKNFNSVLPKSLVTEAYVPFAAIASYDLQNRNPVEIFYKPPTAGLIKAINTDLAVLNLEFREEMIVKNGNNNQVITRNFGPISNYNINVILDDITPYRGLPKTKSLTLTGFGVDNDISIVYEYAHVLGNDKTNGDTIFNFNFTKNLNPTILKSTVTSAYTPFANIAQQALTDPKPVEITYVPPTAGYIRNASSDLYDVTQIYRDAALTTNGFNNELIRNLFGPISNYNLFVPQENPIKNIVPGPRSKVLNLTPFGSSGDVSLVYEYGHVIGNSNTFGINPYTYNTRNNFNSILTRSQVSTEYAPYAAIANNDLINNRSQPVEISLRPPTGSFFTFINSDFGDFYETQRNDNFLANGPNNPKIRELFPVLSDLNIGVNLQDVIALRPLPATKNVTLTPFGAQNSTSLPYEFSHIVPNALLNNQTPYRYNVRFNQNPILSKALINDSYRAFSVIAANDLNNPIPVTIDFQQQSQDYVDNVEKDLTSITDIILSDPNNDINKYNKYGPEEGRQEAVNIDDLKPKGYSNQLPYIELNDSFGDRIFRFVGIKDKYTINSKGYSNGYGYGTQPKDFLDGFLDVSGGILGAITSLDIDEVIRNKSTYALDNADTPLNIIGRRALAFHFYASALYNFDQEFIPDINSLGNIFKGEKLLLKKRDFEITVTEGETKGQSFLRKLTGYNSPDINLKDCPLNLDILTIKDCGDTKVNWRQVMGEKNEKSLTPSTELLLKNTGKHQLATLFNAIHHNTYIPKILSEANSKSENPFNFDDRKEYVDCDAIMEDVRKMCTDEFDPGKSLGEIVDFGCIPYADPCDDKFCGWDCVTDPCKDSFAKRGILLETQKLANDGKIWLGKQDKYLVNGKFKEVEGKGTQFQNGSHYMSRGNAITNKENTAFCRVWTNCNGYDSVDNLIRSNFKDNIPLASNLTQYTVLMDNGFLKISDYYGNNDGKKDSNTFKKYMLSIENLAWRDFTSYLPDCEVGNGLCGNDSSKGRIMWFAPYDLKISEQTSVSLNENSFIGRPDRIYTYNNTDRMLSLSFKMFIDHPNVINELGEEGLKGLDDKDLERFFAGCEDLKGENLGEFKEADPIESEETIFVEQPDKVVTEEKSFDDDKFSFFFPNDVSWLDFHYENGEGVDEIPKDRATAFDEGRGSTKKWKNDFDTGLNIRNKRGDSLMTVLNLLGINNDPAFLNDVRNGSTKYSAKVESIMNRVKESEVYKKVRDALFDENGLLDLDSNEGFKIQILGHASAPSSNGDTKNDKANQDLTDRRCTSVKKLLASVLGLEGNDNLFELKSLSDSESEKEYEKMGLNPNARTYKTNAPNVSSNLTDENKKEFLGDKLVGGLPGVYKNTQEPLTEFSIAHAGNGVYVLEVLKFKPKKGNVVSSPNQTEGDSRTLSFPNTYSNDRFDNISFSNLVYNKGVDNQPDTIEFSVTYTDKETGVTSTDSFLAEDSDGNNLASIDGAQLETNPSTFFNKDARRADVIITYGTKTITNVEEVAPVAKTIIKKIANQAKTAENLRKCSYNECDYFKYLESKDKFIYRTLKEKIKYFHPGFHSTSPESFVSRLNFLQQCTVPGPTLNTTNIVVDGETKTKVNNYNLAFGRAPYLIIRIGDFYNFKGIIESMNIDYDDGLLDLNPEGAGVQPMMATVNLSIKMFGGHSLSGPINKLQNALSYNFYANMQLVDCRADYCDPEKGVVTKTLPVPQSVVDLVVGNKSDAESGSNNDILEVQTVDVGNGEFNPDAEDELTRDTSLDNMGKDIGPSLSTSGLSDVNNRDASVSAAGSKDSSLSNDGRNLSSEDLEIQKQIVQLENENANLENDIIRLVEENTLLGDSDPGRTSVNEIMIETNEDKIAQNKDKIKILKTQTTSFKRDVNIIMGSL